ncbi:MAG: glycosyltransferase [Bacteroidetes bacterium]|nr:glycosyltransferase [Bacteroidota bacterium]
MFTRKSIAIVSVINDLVSDARVQKTCKVLLENNFEVLLIGRKLPNSPPVNELPFSTKRFKLLFKTGPLFYFCFNFRLLWFLLFHKADLYFSNDLDTLLPNYIISKLKSKPLIFDSHELFCDVPELMHTPIKRKIWLKIEQHLVPKIKFKITVNQSIANEFKKRYNTHFNVVRNIPETVLFTHNKIKTKQDLGLPLDKKIIILQGAGINIHRGAEELVEAMKYLNDTLLLIIGSGDVWPIIEKMVARFNLQNKIKLIPRISKQELMHYTYNCDLGLSIDKNVSLNYYYSLPNKIFDYINAQIPLLVSDMPEIKTIVNEFQIGEVISVINPQALAKSINELLFSNKLKSYKQNTLKAKQYFTWDNEKRILSEIIKQASNY